MKQPRLLAIFKKKPERGRILVEVLPEINGTEITHDPL
jgi:hypothetical protein